MQVNAAQMADIFGTLATAGVLTLAVLAGVSLVSRSALERVRDAVAGNGAALGAVFAGVAMFGSLWFSEVAHFPPCRLCWFQRIAMYPLAILLTTAAIRRDASLRFYGIMTALIGGSISGYHVLIELYPSWESGSCDPANPCSLRWVEGLGFWTIPRMAGVAFALVATSLFLDRGPAWERTVSMEQSGEMEQPG